MNGYNLSRAIFDFSFENPGKIKPNHIALYFFAIEHCNRLGWKSQFGFPSSMVMEAIGIGSYNTYSKVLNELVEYGFIKMIQKSKNQYQSNVIALSNFDKALDKALYKALDKAIIKHDTKQEESIVQSNDSINKPLTNKPINNKQEEIVYPFDSEEFKTQWKLWKVYRKKNHKFQYIDSKSEQRALSELKNLSEGIEKNAIAMILQSIDKGWKGFFPLKNKTEVLQTAEQGEFDIMA